MSAKCVEVHARLKFGAAAKAVFFSTCGRFTAFQCQRCSTSIIIPSDSSSYLIYGIHYEPFCLILRVHTLLGLWTSCFFSQCNFGQLELQSSTNSPNTRTSNCCCSPEPPPSQLKQAFGNPSRTIPCLFKSIYSISSYEPPYQLPG